MSYIIYFVLIMIIPIWAQFRVKGTYTKYSNVASSSQMKGAEVARKILDSNGLYHVNIEEVRGVLSDHYDPRTKTVRLSSGNFHGHSIAAAAIAAHEVGHAIQDNEAYAFLRLRSTLVPVANIGSNFSWILILIGMFAGMSGFVLLGIVFMAAAVYSNLLRFQSNLMHQVVQWINVLPLGVIRNDEERETKKGIECSCFNLCGSGNSSCYGVIKVNFDLHGDAK